MASRRLPGRRRTDCLSMLNDDFGRAVMSESRRLVVVAGCTAVYCAACHGLYNTTEPIDAISALTRGSLHATSVAKTAQSSKTRVMGRHGEAQALPCGYCLSVPVALLASSGNRRLHACRPPPCNDACTYIYIYSVHTQFFYQTAAGHARRVQRETSSVQWNTYA